jgi:hypothetical protein
MGYTWTILDIAAGWVVSEQGKMFAYLDPGSGSYFLQLLIASLMGGLFALGVFRKKVIAFFRRLISGRSDDEENES